MRIVNLVAAVALTLSIAACSDDDEGAGAPQLTRTPTPTSTAMAAPSPSPTTTAAVPSTATPTASATATPTATADAARCEAMAADGLRACVQRWNEAERRCYLETGAACPEADADVVGAMDEVSSAIADGCPDAAAVRAAGYGPMFTPEALRLRLTEECRDETASLSARTFGGPQGVVVGSADATIRACLTAAHQGGTRLLTEGQQLYDDCVAAERSGDGCDGVATGTAAASLESEVEGQVDAACESLESVIALDAASYAARAAVQSRCLAATAHPDHAPLTLDCGPRDGLIDAPRGQYVQVVLDEATYGTRCGDGSSFAFWLRLAPEGEPVERVVVGLQGGGVCISDDCNGIDPDLFEAMSDQPLDTGPLSNDPAVSPFAAWTKVYLPYCNQDVFAGGGTTSTFSEVTVHRFGAINVRAAMRYVRDVVWRELDRSTEEGYRPDRMRVLFGGFSAGGFGTIYNYHYLLDDLQWAHTAAYPDAGLALDNGQPLGVGNLGLILIADTPPLGWGSLHYLPPYCFATNCGVGPVLLHATAPRLKAVPEQQFMILSNQVDETQQQTTFFSTLPDWINAMRASYCDTHDLNGVQYFLPAIPENTHVISPRNELYTARAVDGEVMRDWLAGAFSDPDGVADRAEEGTLVDAFPGVMPFPCPVSP
jgi:hypothetical protein